MEEVTLEIQERLSIGFALGWSFFGATEQFPYDEYSISKFVAHRKQTTPHFGVFVPMKAGARNMAVQKL